ncbi:hypothetical protein LEL84_13495 [Gordonia sp. WA4-43]|nr:hypothetical protein LEL84_13495 [Gordonia sp. WA4-43]
MVDEEHRGLGDFRWPPVDFESIEAVDGQLLFEGGIERHSGLAKSTATFDDDVGFDFAQLGVGDVEEVAGAAGGIDVDVRCQFVLEGGELGGAGGLVRDQAISAGPVGVKEQGPNGFEDVGFGGVVLSRGAP